MKGLLIAAIDVLTLILVVLLLGFFAIRYGSSGNDEKTYIKVKSYLPDDNAFLKNPTGTNFNAVILNGEVIEILPIVDKSVNKYGKLIFNSPKELAKFISGNDLDRKQRYVIYEVEGKDLLGQVIRIMINANISEISIAQVSK